MSGDQPKRPAANGTVDQPRIKRSRFDAPAPVPASNGPPAPEASAVGAAAALQKAQKALQLGSDIKSRLAALQGRLPAASSAAPVAPSTGAPPPTQTNSIRQAAASHAAALSGQLRPPIPQPVGRPRPAHLLRVDDQGREIDELGNVIARKVDAVTSLKVNQKKPELRPPPSADAPAPPPPGPPKPSEADFFDPLLGSRPARGLNRRKKAGFDFVQHGRLQRQAETARLKAEYGPEAFKAQQRAPQKVIAAAGGDPNAVPLGQRTIPELKKAPDPIPEVEWWDRPLLLKREGDGQALSYGEDDEELLANINEAAITLYVQHPVAIEPPAEEEPPEAMPLMLTKKEAKKMRKQRREEREREKQELIRQGLLEPPPPKVKLSNMMRVLGTEAVADPSAIEAQVRAQMAERQQAHEDRNEARKLTPAERREKKLTKLTGETEAAVTVQVAVYFVRSLADTQHQWKVRVNAEELHMTGAAVITPARAVVVAEGSNKAHKRYAKLMLERIKWNKAPEDEEVAARPTNVCSQVWQGTVQERGFPDRFLVENLSSDPAARQFFESRGLSHYWDACQHQVEG